MTPERWQRIDDLFNAAKEVDGVERETWLRGQCGGDLSLEREVASLLEHDELTVSLLGDEKRPWEGVLTNSALPATEAAPETADRLPVPLLSEGMKVGPYRVLNKIGEGGMGIVYQAHDERLDRVVALKTLRGAAIDETAERRMWREARVAASLNHPGICRLFDVGDCHGRIYLVMELLEGEPLSRSISRECMELPQAMDTMLGVLDALEALHGKGLVHRDLKPSNIFLTPHGVKLLDFGLSRSAVISADLTDADTQLSPMAGTPFYVSPEQLEGREPDARSDLFAAGIIFVELIGGRRAFASTGSRQTTRGSVADTAAALEGFQGSAVEGIIRKSLERNPAQRYQSARSMAEDLRSVRVGERAAELPEMRVKRLIALPFRLLRPDADFEFLAFSLPDAITNSLSALSSLVVRSSASAARYTAPSPDLKAIAAEAEIDFALTGTLLRSGDQLRVATQLADAPTGAVIWSQTSQLGIHDIFQLQDELVRRVVESLALPLTGRDNWLLAHDVPASPIAYEYYLRANQLSADWRHHPTARDLYMKCLDIDPRYAPAWARLGRCHRSIAKNGGDRNDFERADVAFRRALQLNPELNLAHSLYAWLEADSARAPQAMARLLGRAAGHANDADLYAGLVYACRFCGLLEASIAAHERARSLDPLIGTSVTSTYFMAGDYMAVHENSARDSMSDAHALIALGREPEALALLLENERIFGELVATETNPQYQFRYWTAVSLRAMVEGKREESLVTLAKTMRWRRGEELFHAVGQLARLGEEEQAIDQLARVAEFGFICYPAMAKDHALDPLRRNARFGAILSEVKTRCEEARRVFVEARGLEILGVA